VGDDWTGVASSNCKGVFSDIVGWSKYEIAKADIDVDEGGPRKNCVKVDPHV
jgi:hypothetical protein